MMGGLHPRASLYERPVNLDAAKAAHAHFRRVMREAGVKVSFADPPSLPDSSVLAACWQVMHEAGVWRACKIACIAEGKMATIQFIMPPEVQLETA